MLAHLVLSERRLPWRLLLATALVAGIGGAATSAAAADLLPLGALDAGATGRVSDGLVAPEGDVAASLRLEGADAVATGAQLGLPATPGTAVTQAERASCLLGVALTRRLELTLGLHGTSEDVAAADRSSLVPSGGNPPTASGFSDASLFVKAQLLNVQGFQVALAPFAESGAGQSATWALTRSVGAKAGFMGILAYGAPAVAEVSLNGGLRYRKPESIGALTLRDEQFYQANVKANATPELTVFAGYEGRRLMVTDNTGATPDDQVRTAAQVEIGAGLKLGAADLQVYAAQSVQGDGFGYGDRSLGLSLGWAVGNFKGEHRPRHSYADEVEAEQRAADAQAAAAAAAKAPSAASPATTNNAAVPASPATAAAQAPGTTPVAATHANANPSEAISGKTPDDFLEAEANAARYRKDTETESEDARTERELKQLKEAEAKAEVERARIEAETTAKRRAEVRAHAQETEAREKAEEDEAQKSAAKLPGIKDDELDWQGLQ